MLGRLPAELPGRARARPALGGAGARRDRPPGGDRGRERRDAAGPPGGLGRARPRPARLRARRLRRRGPAARLCARRGARDPEGARAGARGRALRASVSRRATSAATSVRSYVCPLEEAGELPQAGEADLRYVGQSFELAVPLGPDLRERFHAAHAERYGYADRERAVELVAVRTAEIRPGPELNLSSLDTRKVSGPDDRRASRGELLRAEGLARPRRRHGDAGARAVNIELQVIGASLRAVAEEMGAALVRAAFSPNIKERRDCSTALFDERGRMIAQAEHIPIHLGAMPDSVAAVMRLGPKREALYILNDPFAGGSHLPDVTLVSRTPVGFAVSRAHHADVGGMEPASLPAFSRELFQEGLVLPPVELTDDVVRIFLANTRNPDERRGDLRAQIAAHRLAERRLTELVERRGLAHGARPRWTSSTTTPSGSSATRSAGCRTAAARRPTCSRRSTASSSSGSRSRSAATEIAIDFAGTAPQHAGNLNCPLSVTRSACFFVVRCLTDPDVPASGGAFAPVTVLAQPGSPRQRAAARGGCRGQRRDLEPDRRRRLRGLLEADPGSRAGPGHRQQPHLRQRRVHLLRDDRRRAGRLARTPTGPRASTSRSRTR